MAAEGGAPMTEFECFPAECRLHITEARYDNSEKEMHKQCTERYGPEDPAIYPRPTTVYMKKYPPELRWFKGYKQKMPKGGSKGKN